MGREMNGNERASREIPRLSYLSEPKRNFRGELSPDSGDGVSPASSVAMLLFEKRRKHGGVI